MPDASHTPELLRAKLNLETALAPWEALARFFAQGKLIWVSSSLNLLDVALAINEDNAPMVQRWMDAELIHAVRSEQAKAWQPENTALWTIVVKPWVLVQEARLEDEVNAEPER